MKIFIDSDEVKTSNIGEFYQAPIIDKKGVWLPIKAEKQLKSRWCWASITSILATYYKVSNVTQKSIVDTLLRNFENSKNQYSKDEIKDQNVNFKLDVALKHIKCFSHWTIGKPIFERIQHEINQGRPISVRLEWFKGGAHYILVKGYNTEEKSLFIEDSLHGSSIQTYSQFPENYRKSGAVWTETFWTTKNK